MKTTGLRLALLIAGLVLLVPAAGAQEEPGRIEGTITMQDGGDALHGARVLLIELGRSVLSDLEGKYVFEGIPAGTYQILAVREHLQAGRASVEVPAGGVATMDFRLTLSAVHEEVTVTATGRETTAFDAFNTVQVLDSVELARNMAPNLGELLQNEPGVAKRSFGPGSARPIIRGFDNDRVMIMQDGVRSGDLSSQSGDHGVSIDPGGLQRVEILKGPATLLYGSNAIGGVVNTITPQQQFFDNPPDELRGQINADLGSNNDQAGGSANFQYGNGRFMTWFGGGARRTSSYSSAEGEVENSQTEQVNGRFGLGWFGDSSHISASYQIEDGEYGVPFAGELHGHHEDEHGEEEHEDFFRFDEEEEEHDEEELLISLDQRRQVVRVDGGLHGMTGFVEGIKGVFSYTDWKHDEVETFVDTGETEIGTEFFNKTTIGRIEVQQNPAGRLSGQFGIWAQHRDYKAIGEEALSPPTKQNAFALFAYEELQFDGFSLQFGGRIETNRYRPEERLESEGHGHEEEEEHHEEEEEEEHHDDEIPEVRDRDFTGFSGSVGIRVPFAEGRWALVANLTSSYRAPALEELYNYGPHVGNLAFEIGNPDLEHERSNGGEISVRANTGKLHGQASFFYYDINDFIFGAPTGEIVDGLTEIVYLQGDSRFLGSDLSLSFHASPQWRLHLSGGVVDAKLTDTDEPLPRIPPLSARLAVDWLPTNGLQVRPELILTSKQDQVFGEETPTDGATVLNLSASYTLASAKVMHIFTLRGTNLTDELYRNHTSFIKDVAPEMGRRVLLTYALRLF